MGEDRRRKRVEALALALLAALPTLPYLSLIVRMGVPRFNVFGDFALLEQSTRHVWSGDTLLGPYSRFRWRHPGPLFFWFAAPFQKMFGDASTGLYVATILVNALAAASIVACAHLFAKKAHGGAALFVVLAWFFAFGNVTANPWNPLVIVLPLMAYLVACAAVARGWTAAAFPAVAFGALVAQHHVAAVSTVAAAGAVALGAFYRHARKGGGVAREDRRRLALSGGLLGVLFLPPLVEQITAPRGNMRKLLSFFVDRHDPLKPLADAARNFVTATSWLPDRVVSRSLSAEGFIPIGMRWDPMPVELTITARNLLVVHLLALVACAVAAWRRRDAASLSLLGFGVLANLVSIAALRAIVGESFYYLCFWTTAGSSVAWIGIASTAAGAMGARLAKWTRFVSPAFGVAALAATIVVTATQKKWFDEHPFAPASSPYAAHNLHDVRDVLLERSARDGVTPVIHAEGAWDWAYATELELEKDHCDVRVADRDVWAYSGARSSAGVAHPLHVWFASRPDPLALAKCLEPITSNSDVTVYASTVEKTSCEDAAASRP